MGTVVCEVGKHKECGGQVIQFSGYYTSGLATGRKYYEPCSCDCHYPEITPIEESKYHEGDNFSQEQLF